MDSSQRPFSGKYKSTNNKNDNVFIGIGTRQSNEFKRETNNHKKPLAPKSYLAPSPTGGILDSKKEAMEKEAVGLKGLKAFKGYSNKSTGAKAFKEYAEKHLKKRTFKENAVKATFIFNVKKLYRLNYEAKFSMKMF